MKFIPLRYCGLRKLRNEQSAQGSDPAVAAQAAYSFIAAILFGAQ